MLTVKVAHTSPSMKQVTPPVYSILPVASSLKESIALSPAQNSNRIVHQQWYAYDARYCECTFISP